MSDEHFYRRLAPFHDFVGQAFDERFYLPLPRDWLVAVADIVSSTRAVERGGYHDVNYVGVACIVAVTNALPRLEIPSVFGGDGATLALPPEHAEAAVGALDATRRWARRAFGLELRVGVVPVADLEDRGERIEVAKLALSPGNHIAMFRGGGFDLADRLVKEDDGSRGYLVTERPGGGPPDLESLSCRWAPLPSENGRMLCVIVGALPGEGASADSIYREVLEALNAVVDLDSAAARPVKLDGLRFRLRFDAMRKEVVTAAGPAWLEWPRALGLHLAAAMVFKLGRKMGAFDPGKYRREMTVNSDFRKVNGMLRLIIDCTDEECDRIEAGLESMHARGRIVFGAHRAATAVMTCVAPNVNENEHVHYVDGSEGGFWAAARSLKARMLAGTGRSPGATVRGPTASDDRD